MYGTVCKMLPTKTIDTSAFSKTCSGKSMPG
jgi:hypothetical protein